jgi:hypothetical protein
MHETDPGLPDPLEAPSTPPAHLGHPAEDPYFPDPYA